MASSIDNTFRRAVAALQAGNADDAAQAFKKVIRVQPRHVATLNLLSIALTRLGQFVDAEKYVRRALAENAKSDATFYNYAIILKALHRPVEALEQLDRALAINSGAAETWNCRGAILNQLGRHPEAIADFARAVALDPNHVDAWLGQASIFIGLNRYQDALSAYGKALAINPHLGDAWLGLGNTLFVVNRRDEASTAFDRAIALSPGLAEAWLGRGHVLYMARQFDAAAAAYDKALELQANLAQAWVGRGNVFAERNLFNDAAAAFDRALTLRPDLAEAWLGRGNVLSSMRQHGDAFTAYDRAFSIDPDLKYLEGARLHAKMHICDWTNLDTEVSHLLTAIRANKPASVPFPLLSIDSTAADQLLCAKRYIQDQTSFAPLWHGEKYAHDRIRVAYISTDYRIHAIAYLISEVLELHDREKFEIIGISLGPDDRSDIRERIVHAFDQFHDVRSLNDQEAAEIIKRLEIDIAVDLNNYSDMSRPGILARRPAPVQASYLGYPQTMGAGFIDYAIVDKFVLPLEQQEYWTEKFVYMPDSYLPADTKTKRGMPLDPPTRGQAGLPDKAFVFCCFNNSFKITPQVFHIWMRLLRAVDGSVAWLSFAGEMTKSNLRNEAERAGIDPSRLIFAPKLDRVEDHLSRHRVADLFLDTLPYNAHTTAADALWAGLPVVTCAGHTFPARVAGSLLRAIGLDELVTESLQEYENISLQLARNPDRLSSIKAKLDGNRDTYPLFNTARLTRHLESAYVSMLERQQRGEAPASFAVEPISLVNESKA